jgi:hypothetical protein
MSTQTAVPMIHETISIDAEKVAELTNGSTTLERQANECLVQTADDYEFSLIICEDAIRRKNAVIEFFKPIKQAAYNLHRAITQRETALLATYIHVENLIKARRMEYRRNEERKRQEAEDEQRRIAKDEADRKALADAAVLEKQGKREEAQEVMQQAIAAPAPAVVVPSTVPKQAGSAITPKVSYRIDDESLVPREFCSADPKKLRAHVLVHGMKTNIDGVTVFPDETEAIRTRGR